MNNKSYNQMLEKLSDAEHDSWSRWMKYLFAKSVKGPDGVVVIPADLVERWERQANTPYSELSEQEKESDRKEARIQIKICHPWLLRLPQ